MRNSAFQTEHTPDGGAGRAAQPTQDIHRGQNPPPCRSLTLGHPFARGTGDAKQLRGAHAGQRGCTNCVRNIAPASCVSVVMMALTRMAGMETTARAC